MAIADINDAGGIKIGNRQVKVAVSPLDDRYFPNESATNAKRLVHQYGAPVVFCPHSGGILAIQGFNGVVAAFHRRRVQQRAADCRERQSADADDSAEVHDLLRRLRATRCSSATASGSAAFPARMPTPKNGRRVSQQVWTSKGGTLLTNNEIDYNTTTDFSSVASKALSEKPDVLFVGGPSQATALVIKAAQGAGLQGRLHRDGPGEVRGDEQAGADGDAREFGRRDADDPSSGFPRREVRREVPPEEGRRSRSAA